MTKEGRTTVQYMLLGTYIELILELKGMRVTSMDAVWTTLKRRAALGGGEPYLSPGMAWDVTGLLL